MRVLAIDTALAACAAVVLDTGHRIVASESLPMLRGHAEALLPLIARVMKQSETNFRDLDRITPGSSGSQWDKQPASRVTKTQTLAYTKAVPAYPRAPARHGRCPSHRLACRMVKGARDARLSVALTQQNRVSTNASLRRWETQFSRAETKTPKWPLQFNGQIAETKCVHESPPEPPHTL
jgi:hypothetical protein